MTAAFSAAVDAMFADPNFGKAATYRPLAGGSQAVRVIERRPSEIAEIGRGRAVAEQTLLQLRVSEVAAPVEGDEIDLGDKTVRVKGAPTKSDAQGLVWQLDVRDV